MADHPPTKRSFLASVLLHGAIALVFFQVSSESTSVPLGQKIRGDVEYVEVANIDIPATTAASEVENIETEIAIKEKPKPKREKPKAITHESNSKSQRGSQEALRSYGELGSAKGVDVSAKERYLYELTALLNERRIYPISAKRLGESGRVVVKFMIRDDGAIEEVEVSSPSTSSRLNRAAFHLAEGIKKFKPLPEELMPEAKDGRVAFEVPISYLIQ